MKRWLSIAVSVAVLIVLYTRLDLAQLVRVFARSDAAWLAASLGMVVPLTLATAWRLQQLAPAGILGFGEANRLILAASSLNLILPSKLGDLAKAYFMRDRGGLGGSLALSLVVFEKTCDLLSLLVWCALGLLLYPHNDPALGGLTVAIVVGLAVGVLLLGSRRFAQAGLRLLARVAPGRWRGKVGAIEAGWLEMHEYFWRDRAHLALIALTSVFIWFLHLLQIWLFTLALRASVPFLSNLALSPLAILAGLLPLTFAGVGTRDAALVWFYQPYFDAATAAALGWLCTSRYLLPAIGGLPFLRQYLRRR